MDRRGFLAAGIGGTVALGTGLLAFVHRSQARALLTDRMLADSLPSLAASSLHELSELPVRGREEIRRYFHGKCLNVEGFLTHVCSEQFARQLGRCGTQEDRETCFLQVFCSRVATEAEILNQVEVIAADIGSEIDSKWSQYCQEVSTRWDAHIRDYGSPLNLDELTGRLGRIIRSEISAAAMTAMSADRRPALGETVETIGKSAILLLPILRMANVGLIVGVPLFFLLAAKHIWDYMMQEMEDRRGNYQAAISGRLALLGNRVGAEFEHEIRQRLADLHTWQEGSVRYTASHLAEERVQFI